MNNDDYTLTITTAPGATVHLTGTLEELFTRAAEERAGTVHVPDNLHYCLPSSVWADDYQDAILNESGALVQPKEPGGWDAFGYRHYGEEEDDRPEDSTARLLSIYRDIRTDDFDLDELEELTPDYRVWAHEKPLPYTTEALLEYARWLFGSEANITLFPAP
jgi:hypothetical protein